MLGVPSNDFGKQEPGTNKEIKNFVEIGPGKALIGMVKRTIKDVNCFSINSLNDIENLNNEFKKIKETLFQEFNKIKK